MNQYIITLFVAGIVFSLLRYLASSFPAFKPYISFLISLATVLITVSPLISIVKDISISDSIHQDEVVSPEFEGSQDTILSLAEDALCRTLRNAVYESFENRVLDASVTLVYDSEKSIFMIENMKIVLESDNKYEEIKAYLMSTYTHNLLLTVKEGSS